MTNPYISQLCAGLKITRKPTPPFFTYSGKGRAMTFKKLKKPLTNWKPAYWNVSTKRNYLKIRFFQPVPGLNFMIGGKDTCNVSKNCPSRVLVTVKPFSRVTVEDHSGWGRKKEENFQLPIWFVKTKSNLIPIKGAKGRVSFRKNYPDVHHLE